eukprot:scaffold649149_cov42-Prasinocladus_malaysianus.AAC.1
MMPADDGDDEAGGGDDHDSHEPSTQAAGSTSTAPGVDIPGYLSPGLTSHRHSLTGPISGKSQD